MEKRDVQVSNLDKLVGAMEWTGQTLTYPIRFLIESFPYGLGADYKSLKECQGERAIRRFLDENPGQNSKIAADKFRYRQYSIQES